jgi:hypothetical protein
LQAGVRRGGIYIGVGPEQKFTYISAISPKLAFIVDIRRANLFLHFMYKGLFALSPSRAAFVGRLFTRTPPEGLSAAASADEMMDAYARSAPPYAKLAAQTSLTGEGISYLADEMRYKRARDLQVANAVIPVVGNFAGTKALRAIGAYLEARGDTIAAFYLSSVEDYLGRGSISQNGKWTDFCKNVTSLPVDGRSVFVRPLGVALVEPDGESVGIREALSPGWRRCSATSAWPLSAVALRAVADSP